MLSRKLTVATLAAAAGVFAVQGVTTVDKRVRQPYRTVVALAKAIR